MNIRQQCAISGRHAPWMQGMAAKAETHLKRTGR